MVEVKRATSPLINTVVSIVLVECVGCTTRTATTHAPASATKFSKSAGVAIKTGDLRLGWEARQRIFGLQQVYCTSEGFLNRGRGFEQLCGFLVIYSHNFSISDFEIFALLGPPDRMILGKKHAIYLFLYNRFGYRDWSVLVHVAGDGTVVRVAFNETNALNLDTFAKFGNWPLPGSAMK